MSKFEDAELRALCEKYCDSKNMVSRIMNAIRDIWWKNYQEPMWVYNSDLRINQKNFHKVTVSDFMKMELDILKPSNGHHLPNGIGEKAFDIILKMRGETQNG